MRLYITFTLAFAAAAQIRTPQIGVARFSDSSIRSISGVSGSMRSSAPVMGGVLRFASSGRLSIAKLPESVRVLGPGNDVLFETDAPSGTAAIGFSRDGLQALVYFSEGPSLATCTRAGCEMLDMLPPAGAVAVSLGARRTAFVATESELIRVRLSDGATVSRRKLDEKPSLVEADGNVVVLPEGAVADWMAPGWACVQDSGGHSSALYTPTGRMTMLAADPEVSVYFYDGKTEQPTGSVFDLGSFPAGDVQEFRFRIRNDNATAVKVKSIGLVPQSEFKISNAPTLPYILAPRNFVEVRIRFQATDPAMYSAILTVNSVEVLIRAAINPAAQVSGDIDFGRILRGTASTHTFQLSNTGYGPLTIQSISISGAPFLLPKVPALPLTLAARSSTPLDVTFQPVQSGDFSGWLNVDGHKVTLSGSAYDPPPPQPIIDAGGTSLLSAKQQPLVIRLQTASETSGTGTVTMTFQPQMASATDDASIRFVTGGARVQSFQFAEGDTTVSFGSDKQVLFQTGTTAGTITFTVELGNYSAQVPVQIVSAPISFDSVTAERTPGQITVSIWGFDNSHTAGSLAFQFYNTAGGAIGTVLSADAVKDFQQFFSASPDGGGAFLLRASFPLSGDATAVGSVDVRMANAIDVTHLDRVTVN
jgi:hypothetical protein